VPTIKGYVRMLSFLFWATDMCFPRTRA